MRAHERGKMVMQRPFTFLLGNRVGTLHWGYLVRSNPVWNAVHSVRLLPYSSVWYPVALVGSGTRTVLVERL